MPPTKKLTVGDYGEVRYSSVECVEILAIEPDGQFFMVRRPYGRGLDRIAYTEFIHQQSEALSQ